MSDIETLTSGESFYQTTEHLIDLIREKGFSIFARIKHDEAATRVDLPLRPTELIIFGNPEVGTLLMQDQQTSGIELPVKILVWEDETGGIQVTYKKMDDLARIHSLSDKSKHTINRIEKVVEEICKAATAG